MSIVIGICTNNYGLIMSDGRMVKFTNNMKTIVPYKEEYEKFRVMNSKVRIGFAGEAISPSKLVFSLPTDKKYNIDDYANMILCRKNELNYSVLPINFIVLGIDAEQHMSIIALSSKNNFAVDKIQAKDGFRGYKVALPFATSDVEKKLTTTIEYIINKSKTDIELKNNLISLITYISQNDMTVNAKICGSEVFK